MIISYCSPGQQPQQNGPTTPHMQRLSAITHIRFGLIRFRSPLLTESRLFSFPVGTEMFHFPTFPPTALYIQAEVAGHDSGTFKVSLFGNPRITARLPAPQGLSQVTTSFIGSWCLGIHRSHLVACQKYQRYIYKDARVHCVVLKIRASPDTQPPTPGNQIHRSAQRALQATDPSGPNNVPSRTIHPPHQHSTPTPTTRSGRPRLY